MDAELGPDGLCRVPTFVPKFGKVVGHPSCHKDRPPSEAKELVWKQAAKKDARGECDGHDNPCKRWQKRESAG